MKRIIYWSVLITGALAMVYGFEGNIWEYFFYFSVGAISQAFY